MKTIARTFYHMPVNILFFTVVPLFFFLFTLAYRPFDIDTFMAAGHDRYTLNLIITSLIVLGVMALSRMLLFILRRTIDLNWALYVLWCTGEVVLSGLFMSFYESCPVNRSGIEEKIRSSRLSLCAATAGVVKTGLSLLGISVLEKM